MVSMRLYKACDLEKVRNITRRYHVTHGEPIAWGWDAIEKLGIRDINQPEWGDQPLSPDGTVVADLVDEVEIIPVFWGCGVTPQETVMKSGLQGIVMAHMPGHMLILDCLGDQIVTRYIFTFSWLLCLPVFTWDSGAEKKKIKKELNTLSVSQALRGSRLKTYSISQLRITSYIIVTGRPGIGRLK